MITGGDKVLEQYRAGRRPYWRLQDSGGTIADYWTEGSGTNRVSLPPSEAEGELVRALNLLDPGKYVLETAADTGTSESKTRARIAFNIAASSGIPHVGAAGPAAAFTREDIAAEIAKALQAYKVEQELEALRKENAALKKEIAKPSPVAEAWAKFLTAATPYAAPAAGPMISGLVQSLAPAAVGGLPAAPASEEEDVEGTERLAKAIETIQAVDPDMVRHMEQLAKLAKEQPETFKSMLGYLPA